MKEKELRSVVNKAYLEHLLVKVSCRDFYVIDERGIKTHIFILSDEGYIKEVGKNYFKVFYEEDEFRKYYFTNDKISIELLETKGTFN